VRGRKYPEPECPNGALPQYDAFFGRRSAVILWFRGNAKLRPFGLDLEHRKCVGSESGFPGRSKLARSSSGLHGILIDDDCSCSDGRYRRRL
jgi:hypothetical protein